MKNIIVSIVILLTFPVVAKAIPVFTVSGTITDSSGNAIPDTYEITVENQTRALSQTGTIDKSATPKKYTVILVTIETDGVVAAAGDKLQISVKDGGKIITSQSYTIKETDIANANATINIQIPPKPIEIHSINIIPETVTVRACQTQQFTVSVGDSEDLPVASPLSGDSVTWEVIGEIGEIDNNGIFTARRPGDGKIKATLKSNPEITAETGSINVTYGDADKVEITTSSTEIHPGDKSTLTIKLKDACENPVPNEKVKLLLEGTGKLGQVVDNGDGTYTAEYTAGDAVGKASIKASIGDKSNSVELSITVQPDFVLNSLNPTQKIKIGESATYVITVLGRNGFSNEITFIIDATTLPTGVKPTFSPKSITLKGTELQQIQLTLDTTQQTEGGKYTLKILGMSSVNRTLELTLEIEKLDSYITIDAAPKPIPFKTPTRIIGQVLLPDEPTGERINLTVKLTYTAPDGQKKTQDAQTDADRKYGIDNVALFDQIGTWTLLAEWDGDGKYKPAKQSTKVEVVKAPSSIEWLTAPDYVNPRSAMFGETIKISGQLLPKISEQTIALTATNPDGIGSPSEITTDSYGIFERNFLMDEEGTWKFVASWKGNEQYQASESNEHETEVLRKIGYAIVVHGSGDEDNNELWDEFHRTAMHVYNSLIKRKYSDDDIWYLSPSKYPDKTVDEKTSKLHLQRAITQWAKERVNENAPLLIYLLSHNSGKEFLLEKEGKSQVYLTPSELDKWLDELPENTQIIVIIEACYSGNFIPQLVAKNRIIITSASDSAEAQIRRSTSFSLKLFEYLVKYNGKLRKAFDEAVSDMKVIDIHKGQNPRLNADVNSTPNQATDYSAIDDVYIPGDFGSLSQLEILQATATPSVITGDKKSSTIHVTTSEVAVEVICEIIPLDSDTKSLLLKLDPIGDKEYEGTYSDFTQNGKYTLFISAEAVDGISVSYEPIYVHVGKIQPYDINGDGVVDIGDLVMVGSHLGEAGDDVQGDVNGDGTVDISDLMLVGSHFREIVNE
jgi:hypothetical protein